MAWPVTADHVRHEAEGLTLGSVTGGSQRVRVHACFRLATVRDIAEYAEPAKRVPNGIICLPIVEAATVLGFATLHEGAVAISAEGKAFVEADILQRKVLFRDAAVKRVALLSQMDSILKRKSDRSIAIEFFHDILDEHFSEDEVKQQLDTALHWGRYAGIFDYDSKTGRLFLPETATEGSTVSPTTVSP